MTDEFHTCDVCGTMTHEHGLDGLPSTGFQAAKTAEGLATLAFVCSAECSQQIEKPSAAEIEATKRRLRAANN